jgi:hypothetical protein
MHQVQTFGGIVLPKHVGTIVKSKETYNLVHLLICLYMNVHIEAIRL